MPYRKFPPLAYQPGFADVAGDDDARRYPTSRRRETLTRRVRLAACAAAVLGIVGLIALLPASAFGGIETGQLAARRTEIAYVLLLLGLAAAWYAWHAVGRSEVRLRRRIRWLGRVPLVIIAPAVAFAVLLAFRGG